MEGNPEGIQNQRPLGIMELSVYSLFPAICSDLFGQQYATANYGLLYTAKGTAALLVPLSAWIVTMSGSWGGVFLTAASFDLIAAGLALGVLKRLRIRFLEQARTPQISA